MTHEPADGDYEKYLKDIAREKGSLLSLHNDHFQGSVYKLIEHCAEVFAYQYSVNRRNEKVIQNLLPERKK